MSWKQLQITSVASHKCRVVCAANNRKFCQFHKCIEINLQQKYQRWSGVHKEYVTSYKCIWNCKLQDWKSVQRCAKENWKLCKMAGVTRLTGVTWLTRVVGQLFNIRNGQSSFDKFRRLVQELLVRAKTHLQILIGVQFVLQRLEQVVFPYKAWSMWHHVEPKERKPAIYCCAQETHNPMTKFYDYCKKFNYVWSQGESHWLWFINISNTLGVPHCLLWDTVPLGQDQTHTGFQYLESSLNHPWNFVTESFNEKQRRSERKTIQKSRRES